jgi:Glycosyl hydrolases family 16
MRTRTKVWICTAVVVTASALLGIALSVFLHRREEPFAWLKEVNVDGGFRRNETGLYFGVAPGLKHSSAESAWAKSATTVCADVGIPLDPTQSNGTCFAMYAITATPKDRSVDKWWELDMEFKGNTPGYVWINWFVAGVQDDKVQHHFPYAPGSKTFCLGWDLAQKHATWTADGVLLHSIDLDDTWTTPMKFVASHWTNTFATAAERPGLDMWMGRYTDVPLVAAITNVYVVPVG